MYRPHRHFHSERQEERDKQQLLHAQRNLLQILEIHNRKAATGLIRQINHRHQHQQRAEQGVEKQFYRSIHTARAAPHTDNQIQRNQHAFKEHVKQNRILRGKRTVNQPRHNQECGHVLRRALLNHLPTGQHHHQGDEAVQNHQQHRNSIYAQSVVDVEHRNPAVEFSKLIAAVQAIKLRKQRQRYQKAGQSADKGQHSGNTGTAVGAGRQHQHTGCYRHPNGQTE